MKQQAYYKMTINGLKQCKKMSYAIIRIKYTIYSHIVLYCKLTNSGELRNRFKEEMSIDI